MCQHWRKSTIPHYESEMLDLCVEHHLNPVYIILQTLSPFEFYKTQGNYKDYPTYA